MLAEIGEVTLNLGQGLKYLLKGRVSGKAFIEQAVAIGVNSIPVAIIISGVSGCVLALHGAEQFAQTGAHSYVGGLVAIAMVREIAPIFSSLAVAARSGTGMAAEIANMKVSNQVDALKTLQVNPVRYLLIPRLLACLLALPMINVFTNLVGILGGMITAKATAGIHYQRFIDSVWLNLKFYDIWVSLLKSAIFGVMLAAIAVTCGLEAKNSTRDVGLAATHATIWTAVAILIADFFLTWMFFGTSFIN